MNISKYEAAALYHYANQKSTSQKSYLVIDLDDCSYGFCYCSENYKTRLCSSWTSIHVSIWDACVNAIKKLVEKSYPYDVKTEIEAQFITANSAWKNYYFSDKAVNSEVFAFSDTMITCEELEHSFHFVKEKVKELGTRIKKQVSEEELLETNILILGKAQELYSVMYYIREQLSFDPLLPDERFRNSELQDSYADIVSLGKNLLKEMKTLKHSYSLLGFNMEKGALETLYSVQKGQPDVDIEKLQFSAPLFVCPGDKLTIQSDDTDLEIKIPYSLTPLDSDLVEVAIGLQDNVDTLFIRRCRFPTQIYNVKL